MTEPNVESEKEGAPDLFAYDHGLSEPRARRAENHRGFVREMHNRINKTYGLGGGAVLVVMVASIVVALVTGWWAQWMFWIPAITAVLVALFGARKWIYGREDEMRNQIEEYCETNDLSVDILVDYYEAEETYPFFTAVFEESPRQLADRGDDRRE